MIDVASLMTIAAVGIVGVGIVSTTMLYGWTGWLELRRMQIEGRRKPGPPSPSAVKSEIPALRERVRRLEAIASGVDF